MNSDSALILIVDDNEMNRDMLARRLERQGYQTVMAEDGVQALEVLPQHSVDLVLLDIMMPRMNGYEVLQNIKDDPRMRHVPVIMISAVDDLDSVVKCVEMGADDYLFKPFNPILLKARVTASLEKKRLRDRERVTQQGGGSETFAHLPSFVAERLRAGQEVVDSFPNLTVLVAGVGGLADFGSPFEMVDLLNRAFGEFDHRVEQRGLLRVRTTGNQYVVAGGVIDQGDPRAGALADLAVEMRSVVAGLRLASGGQVSVSMGLHSGLAIGGVIKTARHVYYDLWGDAVEVASLLQTRALFDSIMVSAAVYGLLRYDYLFDEFGRLDYKGQPVATYLLKGRL
ncbi:MAG: response regulator [Anaerolineae bacterium]|nr:response regulator [Anaerolineae bacterium]